MYSDAACSASGVLDGSRGYEHIESLEMAGGVNVADVCVWELDVEGSGEEGLGKGERGEGEKGAMRFQFGVGLVWRFMGFVRTTVTD